MTLPPYPGQPEQPAPSGQPGPPPPPVPPAPPTYPPAPPTYPQTGSPSGPSGSTPPPPPGPPGPPAPPAPPSYGQFGGANDASRPWSGLAIAAFVCSLTCCLGIPAVILGIIALTKTGASKAKGRWMAVTGIVLGVIGTLALIAGIVATVFVARGVVTPENATSGQCVTVQTDGDSVTMFDLGCSVPHNAQIFDTMTVTQADVRRGAGGLGLCLEAIVKRFPEANQARLADSEPTFTLNSEELIIGGASDKTEVAAGDAVACWLEAKDGELNPDPVQD